MKNSISYFRGATKQALAGLSLALFVSSSGFAIFDDPVRETRDVKPFESVRIDGSVELLIIVGEKQSLTVTADEDFISRIVTKVHDGELLIAQENESRSWSWDDGDVEIKITVPALKAIDVRGAVDAHIKGLNEENFAIEVRGAANLEITGKCVNFDLDIAGTAAVEADRLMCENVNVSLRGTGFASVYASESVDADLRGVGVIDIEGNPKRVEQNVRGIGIIND